MATSNEYNCNVAIKIIDKRKVPTDYTTTFLPRELEILRKIRHPNVITAFKFIEISNGLHFIVMELCHTDLLQLVQKAERLSDANAKRLFKQMTKGIKHLHKHHVAHRDLKCENILITSDHNAKITDFSFGIIFPNGSELCTTYCGSPGYAAPEVQQHIPYDPMKSDIWSLGIILYVMVIGRMPVFDNWNLRALPKIQQVKVLFPEAIEVDSKCKSLIRDILQYNPNDRPDIRTVMKKNWLVAA